MLNDAISSHATDIASNMGQIIKFYSVFVSSIKSMALWFWPHVHGIILSSIKIIIFISVIGHHIHIPGTP